MMMSNGPIIGGFCLHCKNLKIISSSIVTMYFRTRLQAACKDSRCFDSMKDEKSVGGFSCSSIGCFVSPKKAEWGNRGEGGRVGETVRLLYYNKAAKRGENMALKSFCAFLVNSPFLRKSWQNVGKTWVWTPQCGQASFGSARLLYYNKGREARAGQVVRSGGGRGVNPPPSPP